jgi:hypothetical protein
MYYKTPVTKITVKGATLVAEEGYELKRDGDEISVIEKQGRYTLCNGRFSQHFKDTKTAQAVPLERVLYILNKYDEKWGDK